MASVASLTNTSFNPIEELRLRLTVGALFTMYAMTAMYAVLRIHFESFHGVGTIVMASPWRQHYSYGLSMASVSLHVRDDSPAW